MKLKSKNGTLKLGNKILGPASALFVDQGERVDGPGVIRKAMPGRMDFAFTLKSGKVVGMESKKLADLISSHRARRLHRQLRFLAESVDVAVLVLRSSGTSWRGLNEFPDLMLDLLKFQLLGGYIVMAPEEDSRLYDYLREVKATLDGARNLRTIMAGTDRPPVKGSKAEQLYQRMFAGCGPATAKKLVAVYPKLHDLMAATPAELKTLGIPKKVISQVKAL